MSPALRDSPFPIALRMLLTVAFVVGPAGVRAQGVDCERPRSAVERIICASPALVELDARIDSLYQETLPMADPSPAAEVQAQHAWRRQRDACKALRNEAQLRACVESAYDMRLNDLARRVEFLEVRKTRLAAAAIPAVAAPAVSEVWGNAQTETPQAPAPPTAAGTASSSGSAMARGRIGARQPEGARDAARGASGEPAQRIVGIPARGALARSIHTARVSSQASERLAPLTPASPPQSFGSSLLLMAVLGAALYACAVLAVDHCHAHALVVFARRRDLLGMALIPPIVIASMMLVLPAAVRTVCLVAGVAAWGWLLVTGARRKNPRAEGATLAVIVAARIAAVLVTQVLALVMWWTWRRPVADWSSTTATLAQAEQLALEVLGAWAGLEYANFVCGDPAYLPSPEPKAHADARQAA